MANGVEAEVARQEMSPKTIDRSPGAPYPMASDQHEEQHAQPAAASLRRVKQKRAQQRRYGFACSNCRRKKARCNGGLPQCKKCLDSHEACRYDKTPSVSYAVSLQNQLESYKERFGRLRRATDQERPALLEELLAGEGEGRKTTTTGTSPRDQSENDPLRGNSNSELDAHSDKEQHDPADEASLDPDGRLCFYGKTSLYHLGSQEDARPSTTLIEGGLATDEQQIPSNPSSFETPGYFTHDDNDGLSQLMSEVPGELLNHLLECYWCFPQHLHCVLCKRLFMRDLYTSGPCVSAFLLAAVLTQAARYSTRADAVEVGERFAKRALELLVKDIDRGSSIPTIQGLLILSSREVACGRTSQGWFYSGAAFRMMRDLGLHVPPKRLGSFLRQFSQEDLALRRQVFWSCYTWDKTMSLALGRAPIIHDTIDLPTSETLLDGHDADQEIWSPVTGEISIPQDFLQHKAMSMTRFAAYCELCTIIDGVLEELYSGPHRSHHEHLLAYLQTTLKRLEDWSSRLPPELWIKEDVKGMRCPPLHNLLLNLLYHATTILLCRPYRKVSENAKVRCSAAASMIDTLFTLHVRRFGFRFITYLQSYTMFVACTINVLDFKENRNGATEGDREDSSRISLAQEASARLDFGLEVLRQAGSTPSALRCAAIISKLLDKSQGGGFEGRLSEKAISSPRDRPAPNHLNRHLSDSLIRARSSTQLGSGISPELALADCNPTYSPLSNVPSENIGGLGVQNANFGAGQSCPYQEESFVDNSASLARTSLLGYPASGLPSNVGMIETPLRWLPDNLHDDGSWMLMDVDFENLPSIPLQPQL